MVLDKVILARTRLRNHVSHPYPTCDVVSLEEYPERIERVKLEILWICGRIDIPGRRLPPDGPALTLKYARLRREYSSYALTGVTITYDKEIEVPEFRTGGYTAAIRYKGTNDAE